jgi:hypothetical protein
MRLNKRYVYVGASLLALIAVLGSVLALNHKSAAAAPAVSSRYANLTVVGDSTLSGPTAGTVGKGNQVRPEKDLSPQVPNKNAKNLPPPPTKNPNPAGRGVTVINQSEFGFNGLSHADQRNAGTGQYVNTQFSLEPPDQGLCVGRDTVVEAVNNALAVYSTKGKLLAGPTALSQFFQFAPEINRNTNVFGPFISDPKCLYDYQTQRWFLTELELDNGNNTGATGRNYQIIAVSQTKNPVGTWTIFKFDTTDDGLNGTPADAGCPCFGDQPLIGADYNGFYITTNEFGAGFNGAQVYAISKQRLVAAAAHAGSIPVVVHLNAGPALLPYGGESYSLQPDVRSPGDYDGDDADNQAAEHGIEYFLSALQFGNPGYEVLDNRIATWALINTRSLNSDAPSLSLQFKVIGSETYGQPNPMAQKPGTTPLATSLGDPLEQLQSNDDRMNQVVFAQGNLWAGLNTLVGDGSRTGIAFFKVRPTWSGGILNAHMVAQDYVAVNGESVAYPSVAVTSDDQGVIAFTLVGPDYYPSAAYIRVDDRGIFGKVHIAGAGAGPEDGFTGYPQYGGGGAARWGDYSAGVAAPDGTVWIANEYIPNTPRTLLANWGTFITHIGTNTDD